ncbi:hypothetical protein C3942_12105 [Solimonas fluminis]|uniref:DUF4345 domain-containing protein n=1 Tax=Solimonas fluminis TaxID=2086571 RepID=A0A2S5TEX7_9GAMM|nr:DUF4345 domain-containing protein [Solimonas fluminis]PPE73540.1 hypothetical protein C3942_12105 [Solimonas fluminis]
MALYAYLLVTGLIFALLGFYTLADPQGAMDAGQLGLTLDSAAAFSQMRGAGGGTTLAVGLLLLASMLRPALRRPALWTVVVVLGGLEAGRVVSLLVDAPPPPGVVASMVIENLGLWQALYWLQHEAVPA